MGIFVPESLCLWCRGGTEAAAGQWRSEGLQPPAQCSFTFPLPELLLSVKLLRGFWRLSEKNFSNVVCNVITCFFSCNRGVYPFVFSLTTWRKPIKLNLKQNTPFIREVCCVLVARMLNCELQETCLWNGGEQDREVRWEGAYLCYDSFNEEHIADAYRQE